MDKFRRWLLDLLYEENVRCDSGIESLVDDIENMVKDLNEELLEYKYMYEDLCR